MQDLFDYLSKEEVVEFEPYDVLSVEECKKEAIRRSQVYSTSLPSHHLKIRS